MLSTNAGLTSTAKVGHPRLVFQLHNTNRRGSPDLPGKAWSSAWVLDAAHHRALPAPVI